MKNFFLRHLVPLQCSFETIYVGDYLHDACVDMYAVAEYLLIEETPAVVLLLVHRKIGVFVNTVSPNLDF
jgi:hypothetical protein